MSTPLRLSNRAFEQAADFLHHSRPLERALFAYHFESGTARAAQKELAAWQNPDGGFRGQEPDLGFDASTVLGTCHALHTLSAIGTPVNDPIVQRALAYLQATFDARSAIWPIIPPHDNTAPHAPWWHFSAGLAAGFGGYKDNPRADVLAVLHLFPDPKTASLRQRAVESLAAHLDATPAMDMHGTICHARLSVVPGVPADIRQRLERKLPGWIDQNVVRDPAKWEGYGLRPLDVAPLGDSPWRAHLGASVDDHLDFLIRTQGPDGAWSPHWNWGDAFPDAWPQAKRQWQTLLTLRELLTLRSYGRLAS